MDGLGKRNMDRFDLDIPAYITLQEEENPNKNSILEYRVKNICAGGAYFFTDNPLEIGTKVGIDFRLNLYNHVNKAPKQSEVQLSGSIIRTDSVGMAVKFDNNFKISPVIN